MTACGFRGCEILIFLCMGMDVLPTCVSVHLAPTASKEAGRGHWNWSYITGGCELAVIWKLGIQPDFSEPRALQH